MDMPKAVSGTKEERDLLQRYAEIRKEALDFGIPIFDSKRFAKEIGYRLDIKPTLP